MYARSSTYNTVFSHDEKLATSHAQERIQPANGRQQAIGEPRRLACICNIIIPVIMHPSMYRDSSCWNALGLPHCAGKLPCSWQPIGTTSGSGPCDPSCKVTRAGSELLLPQDCGSVPLRNRLSRTSLPRSGNADEAPQAEGNVPTSKPYHQNCINAILQHT